MVDYVGWWWRLQNTIDKESVELELITTQMFMPNKLRSWHKYDPAYMIWFWLQTLDKLKIRYAFFVHLWVNGPWWMRTEIHKIDKTKYDDINGL